MTKIIKLEVQDFKKIRAVSVEPKGNAVTIGGKNRAGKTSLIDAISAVFAGGDALPAEPIRKGADSARIIAETDKFIAKRTFSASGSSRLEVTSKDGAVFKAPQSMLDDLLGSLSFDPLAFTRMKAKDQAETLRKAVGVDLSPLDATRKKAFDERTEVNREVKRLRALLDSTPDVKDAPVQEVSAVALTEELAKRQKANAENGVNVRRLKELREHAVWSKERIEALEKELEQERQHLADVTKEGKHTAAAVEAAVDHDEEEVRTQIRTAEATNAKVRQRLAKAKTADELGQACAKEGNLTKDIEAIDIEKRNMLAEAKFEIPGLAFDDSGVTLNGLPFEQASGAEQLRVSVAIGIAMNASLRVVLIRDGSLLDEDSMLAIAKQAEDAGAQLWIETVSSSGAGCSIFIEDGEIKTAAGAA